MFLGQRAAAFGIAAGAQPAQELAFPGGFSGDGEAASDVRIRVHGHEARAGEFLPVHQLHHVDAGAANAEEFSDGAHSWRGSSMAVGD